MNDVRKMGRVTIPTDTDAVSETLDLLKRWGADAIRDCDGTEFPQELKDTGAKIYATYYTTRKDNAWAKANPDETQQCYIMTPFYTAEGGALTIPLMTGISRELMKVNDHDDIARWWEVMDRTTGEPVPTSDWCYDTAAESVVIDAPAAYHEYTVSFLAYLIWDPVHMYNSVINDWKDVEHQIPFDVRQPKTHAYTLRRLREYLESHPYVNVVRFTTFFHLFTLVFDELRREKYVDWYGYSASVCPYILEQFEKEVGYKFRPEFIIDQGYYNNQYRVPTKEYKDFQAFQRREVAGLMKEMTDIVHAYGKEAMMFLGDHWIGCEPFMPEFQQSGVDAFDQHARRRGDDHDDGGPGRQQQSRLDVVVAACLLEIEGQRHHGEHLSEERADRGQHRHRKNRDAQQVERQDGIGLAQLAADEEESDD